MTTPAQRLGRHTLAGGVWVLLAELLAVPTMLATAALLTRKLGPEQYGWLTLTASLVVLIEWCITALFSRATIKLIGEAEDWRPLGAAVVRRNLALGLAATLAIVAAASPIAAWLGEPQLAPLLRLFALDVPASCLAQSHRHILVGLGRFKERAWCGATRWLARFVLIVLFVELGLSVRGAILGGIGASLAELVVARGFVRPALLGRIEGPLTGFWSYALPLLFAAVGMRLYDRVDLFALKAMGGTAALAGNYGAAQNLVSLFGLLAGVLSPLILSSLTRAVRSGDERQASVMARQVMRMVFWALPFCGLVSGAAPAIVSLMFGRQYPMAAPVLAVLFFAGVGVLMIAATTTALIAAGFPGRTLALTLPLPLLSLVGQLLVIPRFGPVGAASVTTACALLGGAAGVVALHRVWRVLPPLTTALRSLALCGLSYALARLWPAWGAMLLVKATAIAVVVVLGAFVLREFTSADMKAARAVLPWFRTEEI